MKKMKYAKLKNRVCEIHGYTEHGAIRIIRFLNEDGIYRFPLIENGKNVDDYQILDDFHPQQKLF